MTLLDGHSSDGNTIMRCLYRWRKAMGFWWLIPEMNYKWRADLVGFGPKRGIYEIEIKSSWTDYLADAHKSGEFGQDLLLDPYQPTRREVGKYQWLCGSYPCSWRPTHFVFAAEMELAIRIAADPARPRAFGVWGIENRLKVLARPRRLCRMTPEHESRFRKAAFERAVWFMDSYFQHFQP